MEDRDVESGFGQARQNLHRAAGIRRRDDLGLRRDEGLDLWRKHPLRHLGLGQIVDPRGPAARFRIRVRDELELGDLLEESSLVK